MTTVRRSAVVGATIALGGTLSALTVPVPRLLDPGPVAEALVTPAPGEAAHVWWLRVPDHAAALPGGLGLLDAEETRRYHAFLRDADRTTYGCAHVALRRLLAAYTGVAPGEVRFTKLECPTCGKPHGRPALADSVTPHFSLSHSGELVMVAVAGTTVGADVETLPKLESVSDISTSLHEREAAEVAALRGDDEGRRMAFVRCWTRKEAYLKGTGEGLSGTISRDYVGTGPTPATLPGWSLFDCALDPAYGAAVAVAHPSPA